MKRPKEDQRDIVARTVCSEFPWPWLAASGDKKFPCPLECGGGQGIFHVGVSPPAFGKRKTDQVSFSVGFQAPLSHPHAEVVCCGLNKILKIHVAI